MVKDNDDNYLIESHNIIIELDNNYLIKVFNKSSELAFNCDCKQVIGKNIFYIATQLNWNIPFNQGLSTYSKPARFYHWQIIRLASEGNHFSGFSVIGKLLNTLYEQAQTYLDNILQRLPGSIYWKDLTGKYLGCNNFVASMAGVKSPTEVIGKTDYDLPWHEMADSLNELDQEIMRTGVSKDLEESPMLADGRKIIMRTSKAPLRDEQGNVIGIIGTSIDITEVKKAQHILANRSKIKFISVASHEIRNPIGNVILLQSNLKEDLSRLQELICNKFFTKLPLMLQAEMNKKFTHIFSEILENLSAAQSEVERALFSLENLGKLQRMQVHGVELVWKLHFLELLLKEVVEVCQQRKTSQVDIELRVDPLLPKELVIDYNNIKEALIILLGNAIRYTPANKRVKISITPANNSSKISCLLITIEDLGPGFSQQQLQQLFTKVESLEEEDEESIYRKPSVRLSQAKILLEASGGGLDIKSVINEGTTVYATIPYYLNLEQVKK